MKAVCRSCCQIIIDIINWGHPDEVTFEVILEHVREAQIAKRAKGSEREELNPATLFARTAEGKLEIKGESRVLQQPEWQLVDAFAGKTPPYYSVEVTLILDANGGNVLLSGPERAAEVLARHTTRELEVQWEDPIPF